MDGITYKVHKKYCKYSKNMVVSLEYPTKTYKNYIEIFLNILR